MRDLGLGFMQMKLIEYLYSKGARHPDGLGACVACIEVP